MARAEAYLHAMFHLDPSNRLATVHERHRQTGQTDRQRTDSIGRTVLQTVAQKVETCEVNGPRDPDEIGWCKCDSQRMCLEFADTVLVFAVLKWWLLQLRETDCSFVL